MKKTIKDYATVLFGSGFARGIAFINSVLIARFLGPEGFGQFSIFYVVMILTWQLPQAFDTTFVRYAKATECKNEKNEFLRISIFLKLVYSLIILVLCYPVSKFLASGVFKKPEVDVFLMLAMVCGIFLSFLMSLASIFQEKEKFFHFSVLNALYTGSIFIALIIFRFFHWSFSLQGIIFVYLIVSVFVGGISLFLIFTKKIKRIFPLHPESFNKSFSLGKWIFGATCLYFIFQRLDILFLSRYVDFKQVGIYSVATQMIMIISLMTGTLSGVFLPKSSKALESKKSLKRYLKESLMAVSFINSFIVLLFIFAHFLIKAFYGVEYLFASIILRILLVGWFIGSIYLPFSFLFYVLNDSKTGFFLELFKFSLLSVTLFFLVPLKGLEGGAISVSGVLILSSILSLVVLQKKIKHILRIKNAEK